MFTKKTMSWLVVLIITSFSFAFTGGDGTASNPYQISTKDHILAVNDDLSANYILINDIDLAIVVYTRAPIAPDTSTSGGFQGTEFTGSFDGNSFIIKNLRISSSASDYLGMFGYIGAGGTVKNLVVADCDISGRYYVSGLAGYLAEGTITNSSVTGNVFGTSSYIGGLVGYSYFGTITNSFAADTVNAKYYVGGLAGYNYYGTITNCYATGSVTGTDYFVGGLVGNNNGTITNCYAAGAVSGTGSHIGGLVGYNGDTVSNSYWDITTSAMDISAGGTGKTTDQMRLAATFIGWNDGSWTINETVDYPRLSWENAAGSPITTDYPPAAYSGDGTLVSPFIIASSADLTSMSERIPDWNSYFVLSSDIDMTGVNYVPPMSFGGSFDGNGFSISNLTVHAADIGQSIRLGMFGRLSGSVSNLNLLNVSIDGGSHIGGIVGYNEGTITNCSVTGTISGTGSSVAGLAGYSSGTITASYASANVSGLGNNIAGLVGFNPGIIMNCYAISVVSGGRIVGGLVANNLGTITKSYAAGTVSGTDNVYGFTAVNDSGTIINSFWDKSISGINISAGGTGKTTAEMMLASTFTGWNDGSWTIDEGVDYPRLSWQNAAGNPITTDFPSAVYSGDGTQGSPFVITSPDAIISMSERIPDWDKYFVLGANIDMAGQNYVPISEFSGSFNGNGFEISNLDISSVAIGNRSRLGLFGKLTGSVSDLSLINTSISGDTFIGSLAASSSGAIVNCSSVNVMISGSGNYVGGLVGLNSGTITGSSATGAVSSTGNSFGGFAGSNEGTITASYAATTVSGTKSAGGFAGTNSGEIIDSYAVGAVVGASDVGGLVSNSTGAITTCYATGDVSGSGNTGGLVGSNSGNISGSYARGNVNCSGNYAGGLAGLSYGTIAGSNATGTVNGGSYVGGLAGRSYGSITDSYASGDVTGTVDSVGGLLGMNSLPGIVTSCYSSGAVTGNWYVGGLIGNSNGGIITSSFSTSIVNGFNYVGGLMGYISDGETVNSYAAGDVTGKNYTGGLIGYGGGTIMNSYSNGTVTGTGFYIGGLLGYFSGGTITSSFWDTQTSSQIASAGGIGNTTAQMQDINTFLTAGWDFTNIWTMSLFSGYPILIGQEDTPIIVDIDFSGEYWFGSLSADAVTNVPWGKQGTVVITGNQWDQQWDDNDGHHTYSSTFTTSAKFDGSLELNFTDRIYNIAWNGNTMIHADETADADGRIGIDFIVRKAENVDINSIIGSYSFFGHWLNYTNRVDSAAWGDIVFNADGTADVTADEDNGDPMIAAVEWVLDSTNKVINVPDKPSFSVCESGIIGMSWPQPLDDSNFGYNFFIKKTDMPLYTAYMAGKYQVRFLESGIGGVPYTCGRGTAILGDDGSLSIDAYYSNGEQDVFTANYSIGAGNTLYIDGQEGIVSLDKNLILLPQYQYANPSDRTADDWIGGIFLVRVLEDQPAEVEVPLVQGWNWISFNVLPAQGDLASVFANYTASNNDVIVSGNGQNATYWDGVWYGTLTEIEPGWMYRLKSASGTGFTVAGNFVDLNTQIPLVSGWNWIGSCFPQSVTREDAFASLDLSNNDVIVSPDGKNATYWEGVWYGTLTDIDPCKGYMLKVAVSQTLIYGRIEE